MTYPIYHSMHRDVSNRKIYGSGEEISTLYKIFELFKQQGLDIIPWDSFYISFDLSRRVYHVPSFFVIFWKKGS